MTNDESYAHPGWQSCTFEGARDELLLVGLPTSFREKLEWLEEAETLSLRLCANRELHSNVAALNAQRSTSLRERPWG